MERLTPQIPLARHGTIAETLGVQTPSARHVAVTERLTPQIPLAQRGTIAEILGVQTPSARHVAVTVLPAPRTRSEPCVVTDIRN